jgi:hypothetical protein
MGPEDAAALLLAIMYDDELVAAAPNVEKLAEARLIWVTGRRRGEPLEAAMPPHSFFRNHEKEVASLGEVVMTLLDWFVRYGDVGEADGEDGSDRGVYNLRLSIESPFHKATIHFNTIDEFWDLNYQWKSTEQLSYEAARPADQIDFRPRWDARSGPYMWTSRTVDDLSLRLLADCLRGHEWRDSDEEVIPSYDRCCAAEDVDA